MTNEARAANTCRYCGRVEREGCCRACEAEQARDKARENEWLEARRLGYA
jgi:recombinational DNA repair protein RecR